MYARRIQITNYGPIEQLDIEFPFDEQDRPKPVVLVGENGSGKSILLSHIVNGLVDAKGFAYDESPEIESGQVYKVRSPRYIKIGCDYYFARFDFGSELFTSELRLRKSKDENNPAPPGIAGTDAQVLWDNMPPGTYDQYDSAFPRMSPAVPLELVLPVRNVINENCVLYFPSDRFDEPAWLNSRNPGARATLRDPTNTVEGETPRRMIASAPLHAIRDWLFDVAFDSRAFDAKALIRRPNSESGDQVATDPPIAVGYRGPTTTIYTMALDLARRILGVENAEFGIGSRRSRLISLGVDGEPTVPNLFQLSSGEVSLLNLFFSILRDYDLCIEPFSALHEVRGIVVVDEIDLHLHARHQHDVLPSLIAMFPQVQFIVTTHSPLFVLGMSSVFGDDGFVLYEMPQGQLITAEEFREVDNAYRVFAETRIFEEDLKRELVATQKPVLYVEGPTDVAYLHAAANHLECSALLDRFDLSGIGGKGQLSKTWTALQKLDSQATETVAPRVVLLLHDPEYEGDPDSFGNVFRRAMPTMADRRITKGIEHLFPNEAIERARQAKPTYIDIEREHSKTERGVEMVIEEQWNVNEDEKTNLCRWFCENGTVEDFEGFAGVFNILEEVLQSANHDEGAPD